VSTVVVSGALANRPDNGGGASVRMTWVSALRRLGFDVWFFEQIDRSLLGAEPGEGGAPEESRPARYFRSVTERHGLAERRVLLDERGASVFGPDRQALEGVAAEAALLVNLSGHLTVPWLFERFARKAYVDLDPGFTQFWHAEGVQGARLAGHDGYFTVGLNIGQPGCPIPVDGIAWSPLPPPVVLDEWPVEEGDLDAFTTVASWRGSYGGVDHRGRHYGSKAHEFRKFIELPQRLPIPVQIALDIHPADEGDRVALREHGWELVDPGEVAAEPESYRRYLAGSGAELSVAQGIYVETASGWISDRTVRYLASGRPVLVQDTGFSDHYPVGRGLLAFRTVEEAVTGAESIAGAYDAHRLWARYLAEEFFDSDRVVGRLLEELEAAR